MIKYENTGARQTISSSEVDSHAQTTADCNSLDSIDQIFKLTNYITTTYSSVVVRRLHFCEPIPNKFDFVHISGLLKLHKSVTWLFTQQFMGGLKGTNPANCNLSNPQSKTVF